jgi:caffeoyl-CoA O-methyltransferase
MTGIVEKPVARPVTPLGILAQELEAVVQALDKETLPAQVKQKLHLASRLASGLDPYLEKSTTPESADLKALAQDTAREQWGNRFNQGETVVALEQEMLSGHIEGQTLKMFIHMIEAKRVLEIGMFTGYSALAMAEALPADGKLIACEVDPYTAEFGKAAFRKSPHAEKIQVETGPAAETLDKLAASGESFEFVFIDADKAGYVDYFNTLLEKNLLAPSGFICVDNTLLQGQPYLSEPERTANGKAIAEFNRTVAEDKRVEQVLLPVRDGLTIIRRL